MSPELEAALVRDFPRLYGGRPTICGFGCRDGWEPIIRTLSGQLTVLYPRWWRRIWKLFGILSGSPHHLWSHPRWYLPYFWRGTGGPIAVQVKEKYGTLRFYIDNGSEEAFRLIDAAERLSARTCEECGAEGQLRNIGWLKTLCRPCLRGNR